MSNITSVEGALQALRYHKLNKNFIPDENVFDFVIEALEEFRELKKKATAKKPIYSDFDENEDEEIIPYKAVCPVCGYEFEFGTWNDEQNHHCECGQRMLWVDWSEGKG